MGRSLIVFRISEKAPEIPCVFKFEIGKKFFIWKSPDLMKSLKSTARDLDRKIQFPNACPPTDLFFEMVKHIRSYKMYNILVIPLFSTENMEELVDFERDLLQKSQGNTDCVNISFEPYLPGWVTGVKKEAISKAKIIEVDDTIKKEQSLPISTEKQVKSEDKVVKPKQVKHEIVIPSQNDDDIPDLADVKSMLRNLKK